MAINPNEKATLVIQNRDRNTSWLLVIAAFCLIAASLFFLLVAFLNKPDKEFSIPTSFTIEPGTSVKQITKNLANLHVVQSEHLLYFMISLFHDPKDIKASTYLFEEAITTRAVAQKLVTGDFDNDLISFTHIEGERATHIADEAEKTLTNFDTARFIELAVPQEGTLYPETYRIPKDFTADELVGLMTKTFSEKTAKLTAEMTSHPLGHKGVISLASIVEREANTVESMKMVSGILQGRIEAGMPLQADASIEYVLDKPLKQLTAEDLKVDSPYNTYTNKGLPPTPIGNPGIDAIMAVLEPTPSDFVYYITDEDGNFHYARNFDEHRSNIARYLR